MAAHSASRRSFFRNGIRFALVGIVFGFFGLGVAAYRMSVESEPPPPPRSKEISDVLSDTVKKTVDKLRHVPAAPEPKAEKEVWPATKKLGVAATLLGFISAAMGCVSWLVNEHRRWTWAALVVGIAAMAWTHVVVAAAIAVGIAILLKCV
jgi:hypothetical protein